MDNRNRRRNLRRNRFAVFVLPDLGFFDAEAFPMFFLQLSCYTHVSQQLAPPLRLGHSGADSAVVAALQLMDSCVNAS